MCISVLINCCIILICIISFISSIINVYSYKNNAKLNIIDGIDMSLIPTASTLIAIGSILHYFYGQIKSFLLFSMSKCHIINIIFIIILSLLCVMIGYLTGHLEKFYLQNRISKIRRNEKLQHQINYQKSIHHLLLLIYEEHIH